MGNMFWRRTEGTWEYPTLVDAMRSLGLEEITMNISRLKKTVAQYVSTCPIMDLCLYTERRLG